MPLYEYQCEACEHRFEVIQKFSDALVEKCPVCGGVVRKLVSSPAFQFKGTGWYVTDYAKKDSGSGKEQAKSEKGDSPSEGKSDGKSDGKTDAKTDSKSDSKSDGKTDSKSDNKSQKTDAKSAASSSPPPSSSGSSSKD